MNIPRAIDWRALSAAFHEPPDPTPAPDKRPKTRPEYIVACRELLASRVPVGKRGKQ